MNIKNLRQDKRMSYILAALASILVVIVVWYLFGR